jgi:hypothetical protein
LKNPPTKTGLYWARLPGETEAQVVRVSKKRFKLMFEVIGDDEAYDLDEANAWCSKRPMKPPTRK